MNEIINEFVIKLHNKKNLSKNTEVSYSIDVKNMLSYMKVKSTNDIPKISKDKLNKYIEYLNDNKKPSTVCRNIASIKEFFVYALEEGMIEKNPSLSIRKPKLEKTKPEILTEEEVDLLLSQPSGKSPKELRDKAMLELMYATGLKVSELIELKVDDIHLNESNSYLICSTSKGVRKVEFQKVAKVALDEYLKNGREGISKTDSGVLFPNVYGNKMSRQGFWKLIKSYGKKVGIEKDITPNMIRNSFASHMIVCGVDIDEVKELMGFTSDLSTQRFLTNNNKRLKN